MNLMLTKDLAVNKSKLFAFYDTKNIAMKQ